MIGLDVSPVINGFAVSVAAQPLTSGSLERCHERSYAVSKL